MKQKKIQLDQEEKEIIEAIENDEFISVGVKKSELQELQKIAKNTFAKSKTISIRIPERTLLLIQAAAAQEGIPYQTYITSVLYKKVAN